MPQNVLFLCTGNSARSIMAEALLNALGGGRFKAYSAGSRPVGRVHALAIELLNKHGYDTAGARSKSWDEFTIKGAPKMAYVITLCAEESDATCPIFPGRAVRAHWPVADPAATSGNADATRRAFLEALGIIRRRIQRFTGLPFESVDGPALEGLIAEIGTETA